MGQHTPSRRSLKVGLLAGGGLLLGPRLPSLARAADAAGDFAPNAFVRIDPHGAITLFMPHTEVGGEAGTAAAAPALGNAIFAATGTRLRRLPFGNGHLKGA